MEVEYGQYSGSNMAKIKEKPEIEKALADLEIIFCTGASISIYRVPDIMRDIREAGATIIPVMSEKSKGLITETTIQWAAGNEVVQQLTGKMEHITVFDGNYRNKILLICPATYDQIGKFASGIADGAVEAMFAYALGHGVRIVIVPAMHLDMYNNPIMQENIQKLRRVGALILDPIIEDGKAKIQNSDEIIDAILRSGIDEKEKSILIISGRSEVQIDPVRSLTNNSSGITGKWFARTAYRTGYKRITLVGNCISELPNYITHQYALNNSDFYEKAINEVRKIDYDVIILVAALSDFEIEKSLKKISSEKPLELKIEPTKKLRQLLKSEYKKEMVSFKLNHTGADIDKSLGGIIVINDIEDDVIGSEKGTYKIIYSGHSESLKDASKSSMAERVLQIINERNDQ
ncbi:MAG: bifunctional phosphopantothenoylcysteine decarboxylase/phosphopantothenate--cysteine ligase CoaBC [Thermoplasmataceae archaeon]